MPLFIAPAEATAGSGVHRGVKDGAGTPQRPPPPPPPLSEFDKIIHCCHGDMFFWVDTLT